MIRFPRRSLQIAALVVLLSPGLSGCNPFALPDSTPIHCPGGHVAPTPAPTAVSPQNQVLFGNGINAATLRPYVPRTVFHLHQYIAWAVSFSPYIRHGLVAFAVYRNDCGVWKHVYTSQTIAYVGYLRADTHGILPALRLVYHMLRPAEYQIRYLDGKRVVARGTIILKD